MSDTNTHQADEAVTLKTVALLIGDVLGKLSVLSARAQLYDAESEKPGAEPEDPEALLGSVFSEIVRPIAELAYKVDDISDALTTLAPTEYQTDAAIELDRFASSLADRMDFTPEDLNRLFSLDDDHRHLFGLRLHKHLSDKAHAADFNREPKD